MGQESRARQLGDVGKNAPSNWTWGSYGREPHALVMFFAEQGQLDSFIQKARDQNWSEAFEEITSLGTSNLDGDEPFGFADGISQPQIDWEQQLERPCTQLGYTNVVALGEFLLGYPNEYGKITDRPLLEPDAATTEFAQRGRCAREKRSGAKRKLSGHAAIGTGRPRLLEVSL